MTDGVTELPLNTVPSDDDDPTDDIAEQITQIKTPKERFYTTTKVAELFEVTPETVRNWIDSGLLKATKIQGQWRVARTEVLRFANERYRGEPTGEE